ncbi:hypothetical protein ACWET9_22485 [Streptomyces sp. NPDC004059]
MSLDLTTYRSAALSHAQSLGLFEQVLGHEPVSAPGSGLVYCLWVKRVTPIPARSGLDTVSARLELMGRAYLPADTEPQDDVDVLLTAAVDGLMNAYAGDFELGGTVANVDLLGMHGAPLAADFGYTSFTGGTTYRVANLTVPLIINDAWTEAP